MTGKEKIIDRIRADGDAAVERVRSEEAEAVKRIAAEAEDKAKQEADEIMSAGEISRERIIKAAQSSDELQRKNALLVCRRQQIEKTLGMAVEKMCDMPDGEYFDMLAGMAKAYSGREGVVRLNSRDLKRLPSDFTEKLADAGVKATVDTAPADIVGGFILKCGDIEYCADFSAILEEKRDMLEDLVNGELFIG